MLSTSSDYLSKTFSYLKFFETLCLQFIQHLECVDIYIFSNDCVLPPSWTKNIMSYSSLLPTLLYPELALNNCLLLLLMT